MHSQILIVLMLFLGTSLWSDEPPRRAQKDTQEFKDEEDKSDLRTIEPAKKAFGPVDGETDNETGIGGKNVRMKIRGEAQVFEDLGGRRSIEILHDEKMVKVTIKMTYGPDDSNLVTQRFPELSDYIELFPKQIDDNSIELSLAIRSVHSAKNLDELKKNHPKAFNLYRRYYRTPKTKREQKRRQR